MTREELLALVNNELGSTRLTLNERAINEELDDALGDFGDDKAANAKMVTRVANRLKRMDGSVHTAVAHEVEEYKKNHKPTEPDKKKDKKDKEGEGDGSEPSLKDIMAELKALKDERKAEKAAAAKKDLLASVRKGLEDKFTQSGTKLNPFFAKTALSKLEIPEKEADVKQLVADAERLYNADVKEAGYDPDGPHAGGGSGGTKEKIDEHEWDDVSKIVGRGRTSAKD